MFPSAAGGVFGKMRLVWAAVAAEDSLAVFFSFYGSLLESGRNNLNEIYVSSNILSIKPHMNYSQ